MVQVSDAPVRVPAHRPVRARSAADADRQGAAVPQLRERWIRSSRPPLGRSASSAVNCAIASTTWSSRSRCGEWPPGRISGRALGPSRDDPAELIERSVGVLGTLDQSAGAVISATSASSASRGRRDRATRRTSPRRPVGAIVVADHPLAQLALEERDAHSGDLRDRHLLDEHVRREQDNPVTGRCRRRSARSSRRRCGRRAPALGARRQHWGSTSSASSRKKASVRGARAALNGRGRT